VKETFVLVQAAKETDIKIKNELQLRYSVMPNIWEKGIVINKWLEIISI
jgi:hypothetical protein